MQAGTDSGIVRRHDVAREAVVITRRGQPVVELKAVRPATEPAPQSPRRMTEADIEWLRALRAKMTPAKTDAVTLIRQMRAEGEE